MSPWSALARLRRATVRTWRETSPGLRRLVIVFEPPGVLLSVGGVILDLEGGWDNLPFSGNLASNLAGALVGVPIGLVVLQRLLVRQADLAEVRRLTEFRRGAAARVVQTAKSLVLVPEPSRFQDVQSKVESVTQARTNVINELSGSSSGQRRVSGRAIEAIGELKRELSELGAKFASTFNEGELRQLGAKLSIEWRLLEESARPSPYEEEPSWLYRRIDSRIQKLMDETSIRWAVGVVSNLGTSVSLSQVEDLQGIDQETPLSEARDVVYQQRMDSGETESPKKLEALADIMALSRAIEVEVLNSSGGPRR